MRANTGWKFWNSRLVAWALVLALLPLVATAIGINISYSRTAQALLIERNKQLAYLSAARLQDELLEVAKPLDTLARSPELVSGNVAEQTRALKEAQFRLAAFDGGVALLDSFGTVRATIPERPEISRQDWSDRRFFLELLSSANIAFSDGFSDGPGGSLVAMVGVPIRNVDGSFVGVLVGMFDLSKATVNSLYASIVRLRISQSGTTYLIDSNGRILYDSNHSRIGEFFDMSYFPSGNAQGGGAGRLRDEVGNDVIAAYSAVPLTGWKLYTEEDWAIVSQPTRRYSNMLMTLLAFGIVLPAGGMALFARQRRADQHSKNQSEQIESVTRLAQQALLPRHVPMLLGWTVSVHHQAAPTFSGDFYDYSILPDGRLMISLGDMEDTSVQAAFGIATTRAALRTAARNSLAPNQALAQACELLSQELEDGKAVTCLYAVLDPTSACMEYANAGYSLIRYPNGAGSGAPESDNRPPTVTPGECYGTGELIIPPGERVVFATNGVILARNAQGEPFGAKRLSEILAQTALSGSDTAETIASELARFTGDNWQQQDDVTVLVLARESETPHS
jgi:serine phosphatase RsbU (regulator of sigma subunit)